MVKSFVPKAIGTAVFVVAGLILFSPAASAQTQNDQLPPQVKADLSTALSQLSVVLATLQVRMDQQQAILTGANQQLGVVANQVAVLQNPALMDTENERKIVSQILSIDAQIVGLIKSQVDLVNQERSRQMTALAGLNTTFATITELVVKLKTST